MLIFCFKYTIIYLEKMPESNCMRTWFRSRHSFWRSSWNPSSSRTSCMGTPAWAGRSPAESCRQCRTSREGNMAGSEV